MNVTRGIVLLLLVIAGVALFYCIHEAIIFSRLKQPQNLPKVFTWLATGIGGVLATNLGAVLGILTKQAYSGGVAAGNQERRRIQRQYGVEHASYLRRRVCRRFALCILGLEH